MFARQQPNRLWITDITEHHTHEGKMYCVVVSDTFWRRVLYWSIDSGQTAALVTNALRMAITNRDPQPGVPTMACNSRHGPSPNAPRSGPVPSMAPIGDCYDCVVIEPCWGRMQTKLLNRKTMEHANQAGQRYHRLLEIFPNGQRRHSALGKRRPIMRPQKACPMRDVNDRSHPRRPPVNRN
jgi:putative transposase